MGYRVHVARWQHYSIRCVHRLFPLFRRRRTDSTLLVLQQRLTLTILRYNRPALEWLPAEELRHADEDRKYHQNTTDDKGKDPLEGNDSGQELCRANG